MAPPANILEAMADVALELISLAVDPAKSNRYVTRESILIREKIPALGQAILHDMLLAPVMVATEQDTTYDATPKIAACKAAYFQGASMAKLAWALGNVLCEGRMGSNTLDGVFEPGHARATCMHMLHALASAFNATYHTTITVSNTSLDTLTPHRFANLARESMSVWFATSVARTVASMEGTALLKEYGYQLTKFETFKAEAVRVLHARGSTAGYAMGDFANLIDSAFQASVYEVLRVPLGAAVLREVQMCRDGGQSCDLQAASECAAFIISIEAAEGYSTAASGSMVEAYICATRQHYRGVIPRSANTPEGVVKYVAGWITTEEHILLGIMPHHLQGCVRTAVAEVVAGFLAPHVKVQSQLENLASTLKTEDMRSQMRYIAHAMTFYRSLRTRHDPDTTPRPDSDAFELGMPVCNSPSEPLHAASVLAQGPFRQRWLATAVWHSPSPGRAPDTTPRPDSDAFELGMPVWNSPSEPLHAASVLGWTCRP